MTVKTALEYFKDTKSVEPVMERDPYVWAIQNKLKLPSGLPFTIHNHEYQVDMIRSKTTRLCMKKATQLGGTEGVIIKIIHKLINHHYPQGVLYMFPTDSQVSDFSSGRFKPLIVANPCINEYVSNIDNVRLRRIGDGNIYFRSGNITSAVAGGGEEKTGKQLYGTPVDCFVADELDQMSVESGLIQLAQGRLAHSDYRHEIYLSNPSIPGWGIDKVYNSSDMQVWTIPCKACGHYTCLELEFPDCLQRLPSGDVLRVCTKCRKEIYPRDGQWVAQKPDVEDFNGFWVSQLLSSYIDPRLILDEYEDPHTNIALFYRLRLGMAYIEAENRLTLSDIYDSCGPDPIGRTHYGPSCMGVDVGKHLHVLIGHKPSEGRLEITYMGRLDHISEVYDVAKRFNVSVAVFDARPEPRMVEEYAGITSYEVWACDYLQSQRINPIWAQTKPSDTQFASLAGMVKINRVDVSDATHNLFVIPGRVKIPRLSNEVQEFAREMCSMVKRVGEQDKPEYISVDEADHYRHACNYLLLAAIRCPISREVQSRKKIKDAWDDSGRRRVKSWMAA